MSTTPKPDYRKLSLVYRGLEYLMMMGDDSDKALVARAYQALPTRSLLPEDFWALYYAGCDAKEFDN